MRSDGWQAWPAYREDRPRDHTLACWDAGERAILTEHGEHIPCPDYPAFIRAATRDRLDVLTGDVTRWHWIGEALADPRCTPGLRSNSQDIAPRLASLTWRDRRGTGGLYLDAWDDAVPFGVEGLRALRTAERWLLDGPDTHPTPGALGQATLRRHTTGVAKQPPDRVAASLRAGLVQGRQDHYLTPDDFLPVAFEIDRRSAYVAECLTVPLPTSSAVYARGRSAEDVGRQHRSWGRYTVYLERDLPLGPFPMPTPGETTYPAARGVYAGVWLWDEERDRIEQAGGQVVCHECYAWPRGAPFLQAWAARMWERRATAPTRHAAAIAKRAAVAGIGAFAADRRAWAVRPQVPGDGPGLVDGEGRALGLVAVEDPDARASAPGMVHWASLIWARARCALYDRMRTEIADGNILLWSNVDSIGLASPSRLTLAADELGGWRQTELHDVWVPYPRAIVCREKVCLPGMPRTRREAFLRDLSAQGHGLTAREWAAEQEVAAAPRGRRNWRRWAILHGQEWEEKVRARRSFEEGWEEWEWERRRDHARSP